MASTGRQNLRKIKHSNISTYIQATHSSCHRTTFMSTQASTHTVHCLPKAKTTPYYASYRQDIDINVPNLIATSQTSTSRTSEQRRRGWQQRPPENHSSPHRDPGKRIPSIGRHAATAQGDTSPAFPSRKFQSYFSFSNPAALPGLVQSTWQLRENPRLHVEDLVSRQQTFWGPCHLQFRLVLHPSLIRDFG